MQGKLTISSSDKKLAGVCSGLAKWFGIDPTIVRVVWVIFSLAYGSGVFAYLICWAIFPKDE